MHGMQRKEHNKNKFILINLKKYIWLVEPNESHF